MVVPRLDGKNDFQSGRLVLMRQVTHSEVVTYDVHKPSALLAASGLIGVSVVSIVTFTTLAVLTRLLLTATWCFAAAIPILAACIFLLENKIKAMRAYIVLYLVGSVLALSGIMVVFFQINKLAGIIFSLSALIVIVASHFIMDRTEV
jgi:hypothetical protein